MNISHRGKLVGCMALTAAGTLLCSSLELAITDMNGIPIEQLSAGVNAMVQVTVHDADLQLQGVEGLEKAVVQGPHVSRTMSIINGHRSQTVQYQYIVRFDQPGTYVIGPARMDKQTSKVCTLRVVEPHIEEDVTKLLAGQEPCYVLLKTDKKEMMLGERCTVTVALYYQQKVQLEQIANPVFEHCVVTPVEGKSGQERVNGTFYYCLEQAYQLYPEQDGTITIPALEVIVALPTQRRTWFGPRFAYQRIYSNPLKIIVNPLPDTKHAVHAVGTITAFTLTCEAVQVDLGQTIPISWHLRGDTGVIDARLPELTLPEGLTYYPGKHKVQLLEQDTYEKTFEGVLQGINAGSWTIAPQAFTYFAPTDHTYKTVRSKPCTIEVIAPAIAASAVPVATQEAVVVPPVVSLPPSMLASDSRLLTAWHNRTGRRVLPWPTFISISSALLGIWLVMQIMRWGNLYREQYAPYYRRYTAYRRARKQLNRCVRLQTIEHLYAIFMSYVADRLLLPEAYAAMPLVQHVLQEQLADTQEALAVARYLDLLERAAFYTATITTSEKKYILQQAASMLRILHTKVIG